eukprot:g24672.t1
MDPISLMAGTEEFIRQMKLQEFFQDFSSKPDKTTSKPEQSTERSMVEWPKKESNWKPPPLQRAIGRYAQAIREHVNTRFISRTHK